MTLEHPTSVTLTRDSSSPRRRLGGDDKTRISTMRGERGRCERKRHPIARCPQPRRALYSGLRFVNKRASDRCPSFGGATRIWTGESGFCRPLPYHLAMAPKKTVRSCVWSGKRDSNPRHPPWQGGALPLSYSRIMSIPHCIGGSYRDRTYDPLLVRQVLSRLS